MLKKKYRNKSKPNRNNTKEKTKKITTIKNDFLNADELKRTYLSHDEERLVVIFFGFSEMSHLSPDKMNDLLFDIEGEGTSEKRKRNSR